MPLSDIIDMARLQLRDNVFPYRWTQETVIRYVNDGIKDILRTRPDIMVSSTGGMVAYAPIPYQGAFTFTNSDVNNPQYVKNFPALQGWRYNTYPTLYFYATSSPNVGIYASSSDATLQSQPLATFSGAAIGSVTVTPQFHNGELSGLGGTIYVAAIIPAAATWNVTVADPVLVIQDVTMPDRYDEALSMYVCASCLAGQSEDTFNLKSSEQFLRDYKAQLMGG